MRFIGFSLCLLAFLAGVPRADAAYPEHSVLMLLGYAPGGGSDWIARLIAARLTQRLGQPVVMENRPGADGTIAEGVLAHAPPDGYMLGLVTASLPIVANSYKLNFDPVKGLAPVVLMASQPNVLVVNNSLPVDSVKQLLEVASTRPGKLNFASTGEGGPPYLDMLYFMSITGTKMVNVSYKGTAPVLVALLGGEVNLAFVGMADTMAQVHAGKLRALAVSGMGSTRSKLAPDLPTIAEALGRPDFEGGTWQGIMVPAGTPRSIIMRLHDETVAALHEPDVQRQLNERGFETIASTPEEFAETIKHQIDKWAPLIGGAAASK